MATYARVLGPADGDLEDSALARGIEADHTFTNPLLAPRVQEVIRVLAELQAAGYEVGGEGERAIEILAALDGVTRDGMRRHLPSGSLLDLDAAEVVELARQAALDLAALNQGSAARDMVVDQLAIDVAAAVQANADSILAAMRANFDPAADVIRRAHRAGITAITNGEEIAATGNSAQVTAWRDLKPAVAALNAIAHLRIGLCKTAGVGNRGLPVLCFVRCATPQEAESAASVWQGEDEVVQTDMPMVGSHLRHVPRRRTGGPWLALISAGFELRLNSTSQIEEMAGSWVYSHPHRTWRLPSGEATS